ncbi:hypothetical protein NJI34_00110 [Pseudomonas sp. S 311-6]|uniref:hypothetical protein n=1 Tax=Pseudomonas TaxID=286 RepID=UPI002096F8EF|nr:MULTISPECIES: hypothetical protein [Pseudomonas]MCO7567795.1 hypothetical protein [Pseudomonas mosselii]MCO7619358.1 hypothetical protein [Pseudomonas guariconensis]MCO7635186.1 hypothetical protein [Pseudomonas sp. S 311-6]
MSTEFQREDRYIVIKRSDLDKLSPIDRDLALSSLEHVDSIMAAWDCPARKCLVIESDWPEYEPTWAAIEARVTGKPAEQHQGEPVTLPSRINEMTADWREYRKAVGWNACLDEIAKLGPLYARPAPVQQGETVAYALAEKVREDLDRQACPNAWMVIAYESVVQNYTHADPGEVERLREGISKHWRVVCDQRAELEAARVREAALKALLREIREQGLHPVTAAKIRIALSASAEPSEPTSATHYYPAAEPDRQLRKKVGGLWCEFCGGKWLPLDEQGMSHEYVAIEPSAPVERDERVELVREVLELIDDGVGRSDAEWQLIQKLRAALERKPAGSADLAAFNAAFQKAMETGWDDPIDLARQLWNARGDLGRKPSALIDQLQTDLTARDERMDRAEQVLRKVAKLRGTLEQHGLLEEIEELLRAAP